MQVHRLEQRLSASSASSSHSYAFAERYGSSRKKKRAPRERIRLEKVRANRDGGSSDRDGDDAATTYALVYERKAAKKKNKKRRRSDDEADISDTEGDGGGGASSKPFVVKINSTHYTKLRKMFDAVHPSQDSNTIHIFHHLLFVLLLRYSSLAGGHLLNDLRGGGMQGSVNQDVFAFLDEVQREGGTCGRR